MLFAQKYNLVLGKWFFLCVEQVLFYTFVKVWIVFIVLTLGVDCFYSVDLGQ
jgi:hypothetical protein